MNDDHLQDDFLFLFLPPDVATPEIAEPKRRLAQESGKIGLAILMWLLGVPGFIVLLYFIFAK